MLENVFHFIITEVASKKKIGYHLDQLVYPMILQKLGKGKDQ